MRRMRGHKHSLLNWQKDPARLTTDRVQVWSLRGTLITAQMPLEEARRLVAEGRAFVITSQAISLMA